MFHNYSFDWRDSLHIHACERFYFKDTPEMLKINWMLQVWSLDFSRVPCAFCRKNRRAWSAMSLLMCVRRTSPACCVAALTFSKFLIKKAGAEAEVLLMLTQDVCPGLGLFCGGRPWTGCQSCKRHKQTNLTSDSHHTTCIFLTLCKHEEQKVYYSCVVKCMHVH